MVDLEERARALLTVLGIENLDPEIDLPLILAAFEEVRREAQTYCGECGSPGECACIAELRQRVQDHATEELLVIRNAHAAGRREGLLRAVEILREGGATSYETDLFTWLERRLTRAIEEHVVP